MAHNQERGELTKERIRTIAVALADDIGIASFTMRRLAAAVGSPPMSIYHYYPSKESIIDGMVESVFGEITLPPEEGDWKSAMRIRCESARDALLRHPWAPPLLSIVPGQVALQLDTIVLVDHELVYNLCLHVHCARKNQAHHQQASGFHSILPVPAPLNIGIDI